MFERPIFAIIRTYSNFIRPDMFVCLCVCCLFRSRVPELFAKMLARHEATANKSSIEDSTRVVDREDIHLKPIINVL